MIFIMSYWVGLVLPELSINLTFPVFCLYFICFLLFLYLCLAVLGILKRTLKRNKKSGRVFFYWRTLKAICLNNIQIKTVLCFNKKKKAILCITYYVRQFNLLFIYWTGIILLVVHVSVISMHILCALDWLKTK